MLVTVYTDVLVRVAKDFILKVTTLTIAQDAMTSNPRQETAQISKEFPMSEYVVFHGTSKENADNILESGFDVHADKVWSASLSEIYAWDYTRLEEGDDENVAISLAAESADIAAAFYGHSGAVVLRVVVTKVDDDVSAQNMKGAVTFQPEDVISVSVESPTDYTPSLRLFILQGLDTLPLFNKAELSYAEEEILRQLKKYPIHVEY